MFLRHSWHFEDDRFKLKIRRDETDNLW